jgi:flagellar biosynthesis protein FlhB
MNKNKNDNKTEAASETGNPNSINKGVFQASSEKNATLDLLILYFFQKDASRVSKLSGFDYKNSCGKKQKPVLISKINKKSFFWNKDFVQQKLDIL